MSLCVLSVLVPASVVFVVGCLLCATVCVCLSNLCLCVISTSLVLSWSSSVALCSVVFLCLPLSCVHTTHTTRHNNSTQQLVTTTRTHAVRVLGSALNVKVMSFEQAGLNGGSEFDSIRGATCFVIWTDYRDS